MYGDPGGRPMDETYQRDTLRAQLAEVAMRHSLQHGARIADAILDHFVVHPILKEKK